jgi:hypothetical protein
MGGNGGAEEKSWRARKAFFSGVVSDRLGCAVQGAWLHLDRPSYYDLTVLVALDLGVIMPQAFS